MNQDNVTQFLSRLNSDELFLKDAFSRNYFQESYITFQMLCSEFEKFTNSFYCADSGFLLRSEGFRYWMAEQLIGIISNSYYNEENLIKIKSNSNEKHYEDLILIMLEKNEKLFQEELLKINLSDSLVVDSINFPFNPVYFQNIILSEDRLEIEKAIRDKCIEGFEIQRALIFYLKDKIHEFFL